MQRVQAQQSRAVIHHFPEEFIFEEPQEFTDPFRYAPHPAVRIAAGLVIKQIEDSGMESDFAEGKMLGVLVCRPSAASIRHNSLSNTVISNQDKAGACYIAAFSGNVGGHSMIEGFVPPIYDLTNPSGEFKRREAEISVLNAHIDNILKSDEFISLKHRITEAESDRDIELKRMKAAMAESKRHRNELRANCRENPILADLERQSQHEKAELRRMKLSWEEKISGLRERMSELQNDIDSLRRRRAIMSENLQDWIFRQYIVHNNLGQESSISEIFADKGLIPPGGTGECAAPKLLEYAYRNGLEPLAMGEFWYGKNSETAVRIHGRFYPSCTSKCGPLLCFMLKGIPGFAETRKMTAFPTERDSYGDISERSDVKSAPVVVFEDEAVIVVEKPDGMPSVPGLDGRTSLMEWLSSTDLNHSSTEKCNFMPGKPENGFPSTKTADFVLEQHENNHISTKMGGFVLEVHPVHRLDMDTSGIMVFARTTDAAVNLRRQFEEHSVRKTYMARVSGTGSPTAEENGTETITPKQVWIPRPASRGAARFQNSSIQTAHPIQSEGYIELPLSPDYDERPRQKVDFKQGKPAHTKYEIVREHPDGSADLLLYPHTGRTHQLRVHCSHTLGLARPILGDLLYGGDPAERLHLHALSITFTHPSTGEIKTFVSKQLCYDTTPTK